MTPQRGGSPAHHQVVFVCVDNGSRSVIAERLLRRRLLEVQGQRLDIVGVGGHKTSATARLDPPSAVELVRMGLDSSHTRVRKLSASHLATADLVITFEREHRTEVFQYAPRMLRHCFTLTELGAISRRAPELRSLPLNEKIEAAARLRSLGQGSPDVPPTWRQPPSAHRAAAQMIACAIEDLVPLLV